MAPASSLANVHLATSSFFQIIMEQNWLQAAAWRQEEVLEDEARLSATFLAVLCAQKSGRPRIRDRTMPDQTGTLLSS